MGPAQPAAVLAGILATLLLVAAVIAICAVRQKPAAPRQGQGVSRVSNDRARPDRKLPPHGDKAKLNGWPPQAPRAQDGLPQPHVPRSTSGHPPPAEALKTTLEAHYNVPPPRSALYQCDASAMSDVDISAQGMAASAHGKDERGLSHLRSFGLRRAQASEQVPPSELDTPSGLTPRSSRNPDAVYQAARHAAQPLSSHSRHAEPSAVHVNGLLAKLAGSQAQASPAVADPQPMSVDSYMRPHVRYTAASMAGHSGPTGASFGRPAPRDNWHAPLRSPPEHQVHLGADPGPQMPAWHPPPLPPSRERPAAVAQQAQPAPAGPAWDPADLPLRRPGSGARQPSHTPGSSHSPPERLRSQGSLPGAPHAQVPLHVHAPIGESSSAGHAHEPRRPDSSRRPQNEASPAAHLPVLPAPKEPAAYVLQPKTRTLQGLQEFLLDMLRKLDGRFMSYTFVRESPIRRCMFCVQWSVRTEFGKLHDILFFPNQGDFKLEAVRTRVEILHMPRAPVRDCKAAHEWRDSVTGVLVKVPSYIITGPTTPVADVLKPMDPRMRRSTVFGVARVLLNHLKLMHDKKWVLRSITRNNLVLMEGLPGWTFREFSSCVREGKLVEPLRKRTDVFCVPPEAGFPAKHSRKVQVTSAFDIWQLGCMLYELHADQPFWSQGTYFDDALRALNTPGSMPHEDVQTTMFPEDGLTFQEALIRSMLERDPEKRPTARQLQGKLDAVPETTLTEEQTSDFRMEPDLTIGLSRDTTVVQMD